eukprot:Clim_evm18s139 gene=Clim_evmTU18s139
MSQFDSPSFRTPTGSENSSQRSSIRFSDTQPRRPRQVPPILRVDDAEEGFLPRRQSERDRMPSKHNSMRGANSPLVPTPDSIASATNNNLNGSEESEPFEREALLRAAVFFVAGEQNLPFIVDFDSAWAMKCFGLYTNWRWHTAQLIAVLIYIPLSILEAPHNVYTGAPWLSYCSLSPIASLCIELALVLFFTADLGLQIMSRGWHSTIQDRIVIFVILALVALYVNCAWGGLNLLWGHIHPRDHFSWRRVTRVGRVFLMLRPFYASPVRRALRHIFRTVRIFSSFVVVLLLTILIYAYAGEVLYGMTYDNERYGTLWRSFLSFYVLLTTANHPDIMLQEQLHSPWNVLIFVSFVAMTTLLFQNLLIAVVYERYSKESEDKQDRLEDRRQLALSAAFDELTREGRDSLSFSRFARFMEVIDNGIHTALRTHKSRDDRLSEDVRDENVTDELRYRMIQEGLEEEHAASIAARQRQPDQERQLYEHEHSTAMESENFTERSPLLSFVEQHRSQTSLFEASPRAFQEPLRYILLYRLLSGRADVINSRDNATAAEMYSGQNFADPSEEGYLQPGQYSASQILVSPVNEGAGHRELPDSLTREQFATLYRVHRLTFSRAREHRLSEEDSDTDRNTGSGFHRMISTWATWARSVHGSRIWRYSMSGAVVLYAVAIFVEQVCRDALKGGSGAHGHGTNGTLEDENGTRTLETICLAMNWVSGSLILILLTDVVFVVTVYGTTMTAHSITLRLDVGVVLVTFIGRVLEQWPVFWRAKMLRAMPLFRLFRIIPFSNHLVDDILNIVPLAAIYAMTMLVFFYPVAILAMELFAGKVYPNCCGPNYDPENGASGLFYLSNFDNIMQGYLTLWELMVVNNWYIIMDGYASVMGEASRMFFLVWNMTSVNLLLSVVVAGLIDAYSAIARYSRSNRHAGLTNVHDTVWSIRVADGSAWRCVRRMSIRDYL